MIKESFTFNDILIQPSTYSRVTSRTRANTQTMLGQTLLRLPIISSSMSLFDTASPYDSKPYLDFAVALAEAGGIHIFSRALSFEDRISSVKTLSKSRLPVGMAVSLQEFHDNRNELQKLRVPLSIDIANGAIIHSIHWPSPEPLILGNFANPRIGVTDRFTGNVILKLGVGNGSACSTRLATGVGYPQGGLVYETSRMSNFKIISDGGINSPADFCKAIALGADFVMTGKIFGHAKETPWQTTKIDGKEYKPYRGMASAEEKKSKKFVEGASGYIEYQGKSVQDIMYELSDGIRSAMSYCDATSILEFQAKANFVKASSHGEESSVRLITA